MFKKIIILAVLVAEATLGQTSVFNTVRVDTVKDRLADRINPIHVFNPLRLRFDASNYTDFTPGPGGNLTAKPTGDWIFDPVGKDIMPNLGYDLNIGSLQKKYLTVHAAELWVETLVAQNTMATIGGRILVGPTTTLIADLTTVATTIDVKHNQMQNGDRVYMEANAKVEFMAITSAPTAIPGGFRYSVIRNLDGSGANDWNAGDAVFNTGQTGSGFIDIYSVAGVKPGTNQAGPTIVGNIRNSATYNDWSEIWAIGNLKNIYGYGVKTIGAAFGKYAPGNTWITIDTTNGVRFMNGLSTKVAEWDKNANITLGEVAAGKANLRLSPTLVALRSNTDELISLNSITGSATIKSSTGTKRVTIAANELEFFDDGLSKVRIGSNVVGATPGLSLVGGAIALDATSRIYGQAGSLIVGNTVSAGDGGGIDGVLKVWKVTFEPLAAAAATITYASDVINSDITIPASSGTIALLNGGQTWASTALQTNFNADKWDNLDAPPNAVGFLKNNGAGVLSWEAGTGGVTSVFGRTGAVTAQANDYTWAQINKTVSSLADITTRSASDLSSGTLADARLSSNVPLKNAANTFTNTQRIEHAGGIVIGNSSIVGKVVLFDVAGGETGTLRPISSGLSASQTWSLPNLTGTILLGGSYGTLTAFSPAMYIVDISATPLQQVKKRTLLINGVTVTLVVID